MREKLLDDPAGNRDVHQDQIFTTDAKEVWFIGGHGDVGGGAVSDTNAYALSNIPLRWMVHEVMLAQCGVLFENAALAQLNIPSAIGDIFAMQSVTPLRSTKQKVQRTLHDYSAFDRRPPQQKQPENGYAATAPRKESVATTATTDSGAGVMQTVPRERDMREVSEPICDALRRHRSWWVLEFVPTKFAWQKATTNEWTHSWRPHLADGRGVPDHDRPLFHESVRRRMQIRELNYKPRAQYTLGTEIYVE